MTRLLTNEIATMTELREPQKVLDRARGKPVAIMKNSKPVGYFVPVEALSDLEAHQPASTDDLLAVLEESRDAVQPVLDYLKDK